MDQALPNIALTITTADLRAAAGAFLTATKTAKQSTQRPMAKRGFSRVEAAHYIGVSATTFDRLVADGTMPTPIKAMSRSIWDIQALDAAFEALTAPQSDNPWDQ